MSSMHMRILMDVRGEEGWRTGKFKTWKEEKTGNIPFYKTQDDEKLSTPPS